MAARIAVGGDAAADPAGDPVGGGAVGLPPSRCCTATVFDGAIHVGENHQALEELAEEFHGCGRDGPARLSQPAGSGWRWRAWSSPTYCTWSIRHLPAGSSPRFMPVCDPARQQVLHRQDQRSRLRAAARGAGPRACGRWATSCRDRRLVVNGSRQAWSAGLPAAFAASRSGYSTTTRSR